MVLSFVHFKFGMNFNFIIYISFCCFSAFLNTWLILAAGGKLLEQAEWGLWTLSAGLWLLLIGVLMDVCLFVRLQSHRWGRPLPPWCLGFADWWLCPGHQFLLRLNHTLNSPRAQQMTWNGTDCPEMKLMVLQKKVPFISCLQEVPQRLPRADSGSEPEEIGLGHGRG